MRASTSQFLTLGAIGIALLALLFSSMWTAVGPPSGGRTGSASHETLLSVVSGGANPLVIPGDSVSFSCPNGTIVVTGGPTCSDGVLTQDMCDSSSCSFPVAATLNAGPFGQWIVGGDAAVSCSTCQSTTLTLSVPSPGDYYAGTVTYTNYNGEYTASGSFPSWSSGDGSDCSGAQSISYTLSLNYQAVSGYLTAVDPHPSVSGNGSDLVLPGITCDVSAQVGSVTFGTIVNIAGGGQTEAVSWNPSFTQTAYLHVGLGWQQDGQFTVNYNIQMQIYTNGTSLLSMTVSGYSQMNYGGFIGLIRSFPLPSPAGF